MAGLSNFGDLTALSQLLATGDAAAEDAAASQNNALVPTPASLYSNPNGSKITRAVPPVLGSVAHQKQLEAAKNPSSKPADSGDIWDADEVTPSSAITLPAKDDDRTVPKHEIYYKQAVDSGDVWLGLSDKDPGSGSCSHLVVKIHFPNHKMSDIDLDVTKDMISAESSKLRLKTYLPTQVDSDNGNAKFDSATFVLTVTLPISEGEW
jgi:hypothetical protein